LRQQAGEVTVRVGGDRVARDDHELARQPVADLGDDAPEDGEPEREDDGVGPLGRVVVVGGGDGEVAAGLT
jgi:hypothetical protein